VARLAVIRKIVGPTRDQLVSQDFSLAHVEEHLGPGLSATGGAAHESFSQVTLMIFKPRLAQPFGSTPASARQQEDYLDWLQNQAHNPENFARVEGAFFWVGICWNNARGGYRVVRHRYGSDLVTRARRELASGQAGWQINSGRARNTRPLPSKGSGRVFV